MVEYSFVCKNCGNKFSIKLNMAITLNVVQCPNCGSHLTLRNYKSDVPAVIYKASGFTKKAREN